MSGQAAAAVGTLTIGGRTYDVVERATPDPAPAPPPVPAPDPDPVPVPPHGRRRSIWHYGWGGPALRSWPVDVRASVTDVVLAMCQSKEAGTGLLTDPPGVTRQEILAIASDGVSVHLGIGGEGDGGIAVTGSAQAQQLVESVLGIRNRLGVAGICWDKETPPGSDWTVDAVVDASRQLIARGMKVRIWSALWGGRLEAWGAVAQALGDQLDAWERGFYDFPEATDSRLLGVVTGDLARMRPYVARDDQLVVSLAPRTTTRTPVDLAVRAYTAGRQVTRPGSWPAVAMSNVGWSVWSDGEDAAQSWAMVRALAKA